MPKRKDRVAPPPERGGWDIRFASNQAAREWEELCNEAPANTRRAWNKMTSDPRRHSPRQARLKKGFGTKQIEAKTLEQWQHEVTAGGRIWYCPDDETRTVWVTAVHIGHPKATEWRSRAARAAGRLRPLATAAVLQGGGHGNRYS